MVANKKFHCVVCSKKCSGNVLRYQNQYYHKQCFELSQSDEKRQDLYVDSMTTQSDDPIYNTEDSQPQTRILTTGYPINKRTEAHQQSERKVDQSNASHIDNYTPIGRSSSHHHLVSAAGKSSISRIESNSNGNINNMTQNNQEKSQTIDARGQNNSSLFQMVGSRSATLPHSSSTPSNGFQQASIGQFTSK